MAKPVRPNVLLTRLKMHLRRIGDDVGEKLEAVNVGSLAISPGSRSVQFRGAPLELTTAEFDLIWLLARSTGKIVSRETLYMQLTGLEYDGRDRSIDLRVSRLRKKLGDDSANPEIIKSVRGVGYLLSDEL